MRRYKDNESKQTGRKRNGCFEVYYQRKPESAGGAEGLFLLSSGRAEPFSGAGGDVAFGVAVLRGVLFGGPGRGAGCGFLGGLEAGSVVRYARDHPIADHGKPRYGGVPLCGGEPYPGTASDAGERP